MLQYTYQHIKGISAKGEQLLWENDLSHWDDIGEENPLPFSANKNRKVYDAITESRSRLQDGDAAFFAGSLPSKEQWRLFDEFRGSIAYLDIETTGLETSSNHVTTIAFYDGKQVRYYVHGVNLNEFANDIAPYKLLVTYNGKCFDIPFIRTCMGVDLSAKAHIDLRYVLAALGYRGGLKGCEKQLGLDRGDLTDLDGFFAVLLWYDYIDNANRKALETLLAYNILDVVNLEPLMVKAYNMNVEQTPFASSLVMSAPTEPDLPFSPDTATIQRLSAAYERQVSQTPFGWR